MILSVNKYQIDELILLSQNINENTPGDRINGVTYIMTLQKIMQGISLVL